MIRNVIFDLGQVISQYGGGLLAAPYVSRDEDALLLEKVAFDRIYWKELDAGTMTEEEVIERVKPRLPERLHEALEKTLRNWYLNMPPVAGTRELVEELHAGGIPLYLISNISIAFSEHYRECPYLKETLGLFSGLVFSGPIHLTKPGEEIFRYLLEKYGLKAEECIFVDDSPANLVPAHALGMQTFLFEKNPEKLRELLRNENVI